MSALADASLWMIGPFVILVALVGLGDPFLPRDAPLPIRRPVASALVGLLVLSAFVPIWNLALPLGRSTGAVTVTVGVVLALLARSRNQLSVRTLLGLGGAVLAVAALYRISSFVIPIRFLTDTVVYHLPHAEWLAQEPMPLGTGNLQTRLGFNPGFMTTVAAFRLAPLGQTHLFITEVAIRALFVLATLDVLRTAIDRGSEWLRAFAISIGVVALPFFAINKSGTDGNVGFLLLIIVLLAVTTHGSSSVAQRSAGAPLILALTGLAATFKLSSAMAVLLLLPLFLGAKRLPLGVLLSRRAFPLVSLTVLAAAGWTMRNFAATGCVVFPVPVTCAPVNWGVGSATADITATHVTAFARRSEWAAGEIALLDLGWVAGWIPTYLTSVPALIVLAAAPVAVIGWARATGRSGARPRRWFRRLLTVLSAAPALLVALSVADLLGGRRFLGVDPAVVGVLEDYPNARVLVLLPTLGLTLLLLVAALLPTRRVDLSELPHEARQQHRVLLPFLLASFAYWFVSAPAVRFAWAAHVIIAALLLTGWTASLDLDRLLGNLTKRQLATGAVGAIASIVLMGAVQPVLPIAEPEARELTTITLEPAGEVVRIPRTVNECSTLFPCAPVPTDTWSATRIRGRLVIVAEAGDESRLLEELGIVERR